MKKAHSNPGIARAPSPGSACCARWFRQQLRRDRRTALGRPWPTAASPRWSNRPRTLPPRSPDRRRLGSIRSSSRDACTVAVTTSGSSSTRSSSRTPTSGNGSSPSPTPPLLHPDGSYEVAAVKPLAGGASELWTSPVTRKTYPMRWRIDIPALGSRLRVVVSGPRGQEFQDGHVEATAAINAPRWS